MQKWFAGITIAIFAMIAGFGSSRPAAEPSGVRLMRTPNNGIQPQAQTDDRGVLHLIYFAGDPQAGEIFYVRRAPRDAEFTAPIRVNSLLGSAVAVGTIRGAQLAIGKNGRVHVAWNGSAKTAPPNSPHDVPMLYARMNDAGTAFETQRNLMQISGGLDGGGSVAADRAGNVYVAWHGAGDQKGEPHRRVWIAISNDEGRTFAREKAALGEQTGACACCGMRAFVDGQGTLSLIYRTAAQMTERGMFLLVSSDRGKTFRGQRLDEWTLTSCPMSSATMAAAKSPLAAWENNGQVYFAGLDMKLASKPLPISAPGPAGNRKHPAVAVNARGETLLAWTEGTGWKKGGSLAWQLFDRDGKPVGERSLAAGIPVWSLATTAVLSTGEFVIIY